MYTEVNLLHNYTNNAVADLRIHNFNDIQYYHDSIHYHDMFLYYRESGKIWLLPSPNRYHTEIKILILHGTNTDFMDKRNFKKPGMQASLNVTMLNNVNIQIWLQNT